MPANLRPNQTASAFARQVIDLFEEPSLRNARFPELDLETLLAADQALGEAQRELERLERELAEARAARDACAAALDAKAQRALAYARVFAIDDAELSARLARVDRKGAGSNVDDVSGPAPRKRGRKKARPGAPDLFEDEPAAGQLGSSTSEINLAP